MLKIKIYKRAIYTSLLLIITIFVNTLARAETIQENRYRAECGIRATIIQLSIDAYSNQSWNAKVRSQQGAINYVSEQTANQNLKKRESQTLIRKTVKYVYEVLQPEPSLQNDGLKAYDFYYKRCMLNPEQAIENVYVVDLQKAFSKNTDGQYLTQNKDGSLTTCNKGKCQTESPPPPQSGNYEKTRKIVENLGWTPAPSTLQPILIKIGKLPTNGKKFDTNQVFGNCLIDNSSCDVSKPEFADCDQTGECTAVWEKDGETIWYLILNGQIVQYNSAPKNFVTK